MKPKASLRILLGCPIIALVAAPALQATTYYWDNNGTTTGYGTAGGTWAATTVSQWSTSNVGTATPGASITTATTDTVNFGVNTVGNGLATGSINVSGTVNTGNITFGSQSGAVTLSGGKISLGGGRTITANNSGNVISSELALTGATTISLAYQPPSAVATSLTLGAMSGTGGLTLQNTAGGNPNPATFILTGQSTYTGNTLLDSTATNAHVQLRLDVDDALPTTTVLTIDGGNGTGTGGRTIGLNMNGNDQTLAGLTNTTVSARTQNVFSSSAATLTINDSGNRTFSGRIGAGGTNIAIVKQGAGSWTLSGANSYTGLTTIDGGAVVVQNANALGSTAGGTIVNGTGTANAANARLELSGGVTITGESLTISGIGNFFGALASTSGDNVWAGDVTIGAAGTRIGATAGNSLEISGTIDSGVVNTGLIIRTTDLTGSVILSGANTYLGNTQVLIGKLQLAGGDNRLPVGTNLFLSSGGSNPDAEFDLNGRNQEVAGLSLGGSGVATQNSVNNSSGTLSTLTVNTAASPSTYAGKLDGNLALTKTGDDTLTLTGTNNSYSGATNVNQGTLIVDGNISTSVLTTVASGATIAGSGAVGALTVEAGGFITPGNSPGILNTGDYTQAGNYNAEINGLTAGTNHDQIDVAGTVDITGGSLNITAFTGAYNANDLIFILLNDLSDTITGTYAGFAQGAVVANYGGFDWQISYVADSVGGTFSGGNDIALMAVPEPGAALLGGIGVLLIFRRRRA